ncbi:MAG: DUF5615 family PIN-like protein [Ginsengibacter sp.]
MKILLDENIDVRFKRLFDNEEHVVFTVKDLNWLGIKNGILLKLFIENHFDLFITADKNFISQQNLTNLTLTILVLNVRLNVLKNITVLYKDILKVISNPLEKKIIVLNER